MSSLETQKENWKKTIVALFEKSLKHCGTLSYCVLQSNARVFRKCEFLLRAFVGLYPLITFANWIPFKSSFCSSGLRSCWRCTTPSWIYTLIVAKSYLCTLPWGFFLVFALLHGNWTNNSWNVWKMVNKILISSSCSAFANAPKTTILFIMFHFFSIRKQTFCTMNTLDYFKMLTFHNKIRDQFNEINNVSEFE